MVDVDFGKRIEAELAAIRRAMAELVAEKNAPAITPMAVDQKRAATMLGVSAKHVSRMLRRGEIFPSDIGGALRIPVSEISRLLAPRMKSNGAAPEQVRFDGAAAMRRLKQLRSTKRGR